MARTGDDTWDLASSVGATATMVAAARALASAEPNALIHDPYAAPLVRAVGIEFFTKLVDGRLPSSDDGGASRTLTDVMAVRTRFFDDFFLARAAPATTSDQPVGADIRQAVILASGLDSRAYRLPWPEGTVVYEIDQPDVIHAKTAAMTAIGATPTVDRRAVAVDLRDDWPAALTAAGLDPTKPVAWSAEGLLIYLPPEAQDRLFDDITALSAPGSRLATEYHPDGGAFLGDRESAVTESWRQQGFDVNLSDLIYSGERHSVVDYLTAQGWHVVTRTRPEVFDGYGRAFPEAAGPLRNSLAVVATLT